MYGKDNGAAISPCSSRSSETQTTSELTNAVEAVMHGSIDRAMHERIADYIKAGCDICS
jgi:hypothetical protein